MYDILNIYCTNILAALFVVSGLTNAVRSETSYSLVKFFKYKLFILARFKSIFFLDERYVELFYLIYDELF